MFLLCKQKSYLHGYTPNIKCVKDSVHPKYCNNRHMRHVEKENNTYKNRFLLHYCYIWFHTTSFWEVVEPRNTYLNIYFGFEGYMLAFAYRCTKMLKFYTINIIIRSMVFLLYVVITSLWAIRTNKYKNDPMIYCAWYITSCLRCYYAQIFLCFYLAVVCHIKRFEGKI